MNILQAIHHLDKIASLGSLQIHQLNEGKLFENILNLCSSEDLIIKRFAYKLLVQMTSTIMDLKRKMISDETLIGNTKEIFTSSPDDILVEFSSVLLVIICENPKKVDSFGRDEIFLNSIFNKFKSHDADILLHSMRLLNAVMKNSMLIESILKLKDFPFKNLQIELKNEIPEIQIASLDSFLIITSFLENPFWDQLSSDRLIQVVYEMCTVRIGKNEIEETIKSIFSFQSKNLRTTFS